MNWRFESAAIFPLSFARSELSLLAENLSEIALGPHAFSRQLSLEMPSNVAFGPKPPI